MTYQRTKARLNRQTEEMEAQMLEMSERGVPMEQLGRTWGFTDRRAVWYHINRARKRRDANKEEKRKCS